MSAARARAIHELVLGWVGGASGVLREGLELYLERWLELGEGHGTALLPTWIGASLTGDPTPYLPVGAATWSSWMAADLLDEAADRELPPAWHARFGDAALDVAYTAATAMFAFAPPHVLAAGGVAADVRAELEALRGSLMLRSGSGHADDLLSLTRAPWSLDEYEAHLRLKCGEHLRYQMRVALPVARRLAELPVGLEPAIDAAAAALALALQLADDLEELFSPIDHDTLVGRATWPILWAREHATPALLTAIDAAWRAGHDPAVHVPALVELRRGLAESGAITAITLRIERYVRAARRALAQVPVTWVRELTDMLERLSPLAQLRSRARPGAS